MRYSPPHDFPAPSLALGAGKSLNAEGKGCILKMRPFLRSSGGDEGDVVQACVVPGVRPIRGPSGRHVRALGHFAWHGSLPRRLRGGGRLQPA
ncbi:hypothetical protein Dvul_2663 [Nitratidesulfovibrio vulgaris DP4]|uniref:Uncharacterized protein n=1 Tax=Nitratidesulfovibrio vulgaris (strain DP4) TaxID=391774 RepID=A0A0H3ACX2_NITV4|nr:hypothetical protein Dvul_2663 [Nitratidesulfovibrio vulgaris DP4]